MNEFENEFLSEINEIFFNFSNNLQDIEEFNLLIVLSSEPSVQGHRLHPESHHIRRKPSIIFFNGFENNETMILHTVIAMNLKLISKYNVRRMSTVLPLIILLLKQFTPFNDDYKGIQF